MATDKPMSQEDIIKDALARLKKLQGIREQASEKLAADQALMNVYEGERDKGYEVCRTTYKIEPDQLKNEISKRTKALVEDVEKLEGRFNLLTEEDGTK